MNGDTESQERKESDEMRILRAIQETTAETNNRVAKIETDNTRPLKFMEESNQRNSDVEKRCEFLEQ